MYALLACVTSSTTGSGRRCWRERRRLHGSYSNEHFVVRVEVVEFLLTQFLCHQPMQESHSREDVAVRLHGDACCRKDLRKQFVGRERSKAPVLSPVVHVPAGNLTDAVTGNQEYAARFQDAAQGVECGADIVNELQGLGEDDAVKSV